MATRRRPNSSMRPSASSFGNGVHWRICHSTWADVMGSMGFSMWISWGFVGSDGILWAFRVFTRIHSVFLWHSECSFSFLWWGFMGFPTMRDPQSSPWARRSPRRLDSTHLQLLRGRVRRESPPTGSIRSGTLDGGGFGCQESMDQWADATNLCRFWRHFSKNLRRDQHSIQKTRFGVVFYLVFSDLPEVRSLAPLATPQERLPTCQERLRADGVGPRLRCLGEDSRKRVECTMVFLNETWAIW